MGRYILGVATIFSPLLTSVTAAVYDDWKSILASHFNPLVAGLIASISIGGVGLVVICLVGWVVWRVFTGRRRNRITKYFIEDAKGFAKAMEGLRIEINREIESYRDCIKKKTSHKYDYSRWDQLVFLCQLAINNNNLFKDDKNIDKWLQRNSEFSVVRALRDPIISGYERIQELLSNPANRNYECIHRAEEMASDVQNRHLNQFIGSLSNL